MDRRVGRDVGRDVVSAFNKNQFPMNMKILSITTLSGLALLFSLEAVANHNSMESLKARVSATGTLNVAENNTVAASSQQEAGPADGEAVYQTTCVTCHSAGIAGSPVVGDVDDWAARLEQGFETLVTHAIEGYTGSTGFMPAKGGNPSLSDEAVTAAVQYMIDQSR